MSSPPKNISCHVGLKVPKTACQQISNFFDHLSQPLICSIEKLKKFLQNYYEQDGPSLVPSSYLT